MLGVQVSGLICVILFEKSAITRFWFLQSIFCTSTFTSMFNEPKLDSDVFQINQLKTDLEKCSSNSLL